MLKKAFFVFIISLFFQIGFTQENTLQYAEKFTISNGLAHNGVTCLLEDSRGFIWFGTYDGLNRYDGYKLKTFKNTIDFDILTSNRIRTLSEDNNGNIWIGTDEGITIYNHTTESFKNIYSNKRFNNNVSGPIVRKVFFNKKTNTTICVTEGDGILIFDNNYSFISKQYPDISTSSKDLSFFEGTNLNSEEVLFATSEGLIVYNFIDKKFNKILKKIKYSRAIIRIDDRNFLVAKRKGVCIISHNEGQFNVNHYSLNNFQVNSMVIDNSRNLWIGLLNGGLLKLTKPNFKKGLNKQNAKAFKDNLQILRSSALMVSSHNHCWFATFNEGVYKFNSDDNGFNHYHVGLKNNFGIQSNFISFISNFDKDRMLLSENIGGLTLFNTKTKKFEPLPFKLPKKNKNEGGAYRDSKGNIWINYIGDTALYRVLENSNNYEKVTPDESIKNLPIRTFTEDKLGNIWIASSDKVYRININKSNNITSIEKLHNNPYFNDIKLGPIRCLYPDPIYDFIWIGSESEGLFRVDISNRKDLKNSLVEKYIKDTSKNSISSNFVSSIIRLPNKDLWIGTEGGGICKVNNSETTPEFIPYTEKNGLSNNVVKNILYDKNQNLWIPTNIGLNKFNVKEDKFRKFNTSDGLPFEDFWFEAIKSENGTFMLSGLDGLCYFNPDDINKKEPSSKLHFENFKIFNKTVLPNDTINKRVLMSKNLNMLDKLTLKHNESVFSLDITSLHFSNTNNHSIRYKLFPINNEYIEVPSIQKTISYSGLPAGEYELIAQASNSLKEWTAPKKIKIIILPSMWHTNLAYFLYSLLALFMAYVIVKVILKLQSLKHKVEIEQIERDKIREINEAKLTFFSNISHEIKTPITLISEPIKTLLSKYRGNAEVKEKLGLVQRQTKKIIGLVDQVHDFRKAEVNALKLNYTRFNFNSFLQELTQDFKQLALSENKTFEIETSKKAIIVSADRDKLGKIFNNLISNAFKHTKKGDFIKLNFSYEEKDLTISLTDSGSGIDKADLPFIFERFYQSKQRTEVHQGGSGIGLAFSKQLIEMHYGYIEVLSEINKGTEAIVKLPIVKEILEKEEVNEVSIPKEDEVQVDIFFEKESRIDTLKTTGEFSESLIFYVEDNHELRNYVSDLLAKFFRVHTFTNGKECLKAMESEWPDIVISDVQMPEMNGLELCVQIKSDLKTSHIPVILLTALTKIEDHLQGIRDGADAYIKKPFNAKHLITKVEALLINRKQLQERYQVGIPLSKENNRNSKNDNAFLEKFYSLIEKNIDNQNFDFDTLSKELYLNRTHFYKKVKVLTNQTPSEILRKYRLKKAAHLLVHEKLSVNQVFMLTGFKSRPHFSKIFKEHYGTTPGKYTKSVD